MNAPPPLRRAFPSFSSLFRGVVLPRSGPGPAMDVIQCWLDASHFRVRGQEQADFLWRRVFKPAFSS